MALSTNSVNKHCVVTGRERKMADSLRIYRYFDKVAVTPIHGPTFHLTADQATRVVEAMSGCLDDIQASEFADSEFGTVEVGPPSSSS